MRRLKFQIFIAVLAALSALLRPVVRWVVRLAGLFKHWQDQAEIALLQHRAMDKVQMRLGSQQRDLPPAHGLRLLQKALEKFGKDLESRFPGSTSRGTGK